MGDHMQQGMSLGDRSFPCVKLRGLPFDVSEEDIRTFLGCEPIDILLVKRDGRLSGEAFIVLSSPIQVELAVSKNKSYMGRRYIEVFPSKKLDYYKAVVQEMLEGGGGGGGGGGMMGRAPPPMPMGPPMPYMEQGAASNEPVTVLRLRGLPFSTHADDIVRWFQDVAPVNAAQVHIVSEYNRPTGVAFVEFNSPQDAGRGMAKDRQMMGNRYVEIFHSSPQEMSRFVQRY